MIADVGRKSTKMYFKFTKSLDDVTNKYYDVNVSYIMDEIEALGGHMAQVRIELEKDEVKEARQLHEELRKLKDKDKIKLLAFLQGVSFAGKS